MRAVFIDAQERTIEPIMHFLCVLTVRMLALPRLLSRLFWQAL